MAVNLIGALAAASAFLLLAPPSQAELRILDGDTLHLDGQKIRFFGIDAPEKRQQCDTKEGQKYDCADMATRELRRIVSAGGVRCEGRGQDRYRRQIAICYVNRTDIGREMVRRGWALAYRKYSTRYVIDEQHAEKNKLGMWAGSFTAPWEWRRAR